ncbi:MULTISPECIES: hypothetical protein [Paraburkholderia]|uniref:Uncharacterized protein n=1 Tax=Paraburkholderia unamae TaxID=219649 RepID=A0ACC6RV99_9BURK
MLSGTCRRNPETRESSTLRGFFCCRPEAGTPFFGRRSSVLRMPHGLPRPAAIVVDVIEIANRERTMDRIFMTREEAIRILIEAHESVSGRAAATLIRSSADKSAKLEALDRLLLDVRAGRVDEFRTWPEDSTCVSITD